MKTITIYEVNGKRFDSIDDARNYEHLCRRISKIMSTLKPRTKDVEEGLEDVRKHKEYLEKL